MGSQAISDDLPGADPKRLLAHVTALVEFSRRASDSFEQYSDTVIAFLVKHVLLVSTAEDLVKINLNPLRSQSLTIAGLGSNGCRRGLERGQSHIGHAAHQDSLPEAVPSSLYRPSEV